MILWLLCAFYEAAIFVCLAVMRSLFNTIYTTGLWQELGKFHCPELSPVS